MNMEFLEIWGTLDDGVNFIVRSPIESIQKSIALSNRFYLMVALGVCVIGAAFIAFLAKRLTKPLTELTFSPLFLYPLTSYESDHSLFPWFHLPYTEPSLARW